MKPWFKTVGMVIAIPLLGTLFYQKVYLPKTTYSHIRPTKGSLSISQYGVGNVGAKEIYKVMPSFAGKVETIACDEGDWVEKGRALVTLDLVDLPELKEEATLAFEKAQAEVEASKQEEKRLLAQKILQEKRLKRYTALYHKGVTSLAEYESVQTEFEVAYQLYKTASVHLHSSLLEAQRMKKMQEGIEKKMARYTLYAPVSGYVITKNVEPAQSVLPSQALLEIVNPQSVWVKTYIDEKVSGAIRVGQKATIHLRSSVKTFEAEVKRIVMQSDKVTQEREIDVAFKMLPEPFYMNEQAEVRIASKTYEDVIKVPAKALDFYEKQRGVWVVREKKAHFIPVKILARGEEEVAVEGLPLESDVLLQSEHNKALKEGMSIHL